MENLPVAMVGATASHGELEVEARSPQPWLDKPSASSLGFPAWRENGWYEPPPRQEEVMPGGPSGSVRSLADTHGLVTRPGTRIWASSDGLGWPSVFATTQREAPFEGYFRPVADHLIVVHLSGPVRVCRTLAGKVESRLIPPGGSFIMPGGVDFGVRLEAELDTVHFYLRRAIVEEIAEAFGRGGAVDIIPGLGTLDPLLEQIAVGLREQLHDAAPASALYVDHLARAAAARLVHAHSTARLDGALSMRKSGLSERQLRRAIDYIETHLESDPNLRAVAAVTGLSPVYFTRQFKRATGLPPHQYLLRRRLERAKRLLSAGDEPIAAIALDCGFCHQEHLTRVFRQHYGTTPGAYRDAVKR
jgi:AraC family transcriptional regulator